MKLHEMDVVEAMDLKEQRGIEEYRGGDPSKPFQGDALAEGYEDAIDVAVYLRQAEREGRVPGDIGLELAHNLRQVIDGIRLLLGVNP